MDLERTYIFILQLSLMYLAIVMGTYHGMNKELLKNILEDNIEKEEVPGMHRRVFWYSLLWPVTFGITAKWVFFGTDEDEHTTA